MELPPSLEDTKISPRNDSFLLCVPLPSDNDDIDTTEDKADFNDDMAISVEVCCRSCGWLLFVLDA
jgi:hypothetical protein